MAHDGQDVIACTDVVIEDLLAITKSTLASRGFAYRCKRKNRGTAIRYRKMEKVQRTCRGKTDSGRMGLLACHLCKFFFTRCSCGQKNFQVEGNFFRN